MKLQYLVQEKKKDEIGNDDILDALDRIQIGLEKIGGVFSKER